MLYVFIFFLIPISLQFDCEPGYVLYNNNCVPCSDSNCLVCSSVLPHSCYECTPSFTLYERQCAVSDCKKIKHCSLCNNNECLKCSGICILDNGKCNCTEKIVIIIVCILIGVLALGVVIYCLVKPSRIRNTAIINIVNMRQETINEQGELELDNTLIKNYTTPFIILDNYLAETTTPELCIKFECNGFCSTIYEDNDKQRVMIKYLFRDVNIGYPKQRGCMIPFMKWIKKMLLSFGVLTLLSGLIQIAMFGCGVSLFLVDVTGKINDKEPIMNDKKVEMTSTQKIV